ncbi:MAG: T9SS type A sorting domain-containing protein [Rhodothermales bacterium]
MLALRYVSLLAFVCIAPSALAQTWTLQSAPTAADLNAVFAVDTQTAYVGSDGGTLLTTADGGQTWATQSFPGFDLEGIAFNGSGVGIVVTDDGVVYRTTNGAAFAPIGTGAEDLRGVAWGTETFVFAAGREASGARSSDGGLTWTAFSTGAVERTEGVEAVGTNLLWAVGRGGEIRFSSNGGATWGAQASGTANDLKAIQMLSPEIGYIVGSGDTVLKTTNGGATWTNISNGNAGGDALSFLDESTGWTADDAGQVWHTTDGGATWQLQPTPTGVDLSGISFVSATQGWAVGDAGTIIAFGSGTTDAEDGAAPARLRLSAAHPNPFATATTLRYNLAESGLVTLAVYDVLGRAVAVLADGVQGAGEHEAVLVAKGLPSGVYFVRLATGSSSETRRVTLAR